MDVIEPARGEWAGPVVMVPKPDGSRHFCIDFRKLNLTTIKDALPIARMDECIYSLGDARVFSSLDCNAGYWPMPVAEEDKHLTDIPFHTGALPGVRLLFGLCNAAATFQRAMDMILDHVKWQICLVYLDDVIVFSRSPEEGPGRPRFLQRAMTTGLHALSSMPFSAPIHSRHGTIGRSRVHADSSTNRKPSFYPSQAPSPHPPPGLVSRLPPAEWYESFAARPTCVPYIGPSPSCCPCNFVHGPSQVCGPLGVLHQTQACGEHGNDWLRTCPRLISGPHGRSVRVRCGLQSWNQKTDDGPICRALGRPA